MGYAKNPATVRRIESQLAALAALHQTSWTVDGNAEHWAYKIREALWIARYKHPALFPQLAKAHETFTISIEGQRVFARYKLGTAVSVHETGLDVTTLDPEPTRAGALTSADTRTLIGPRSVEEVIQFWLDAQPSNDAIAVTEASGLSDNDLTILERWASGQTPAWKIVHNAGQTHFSIRPSSRRKFTTEAPPMTQAKPGDRAEPEEVTG